MDADEVRKVAKMIQLDYENYKKKVQGCFIGKTVGGTLGMKYEGNTGVNPVTYYDPIPDKMLPNDDLDLQIVNMEIIKQYGLPVSRFYIGDIWKEHMDEHAPDEYGVALSNNRMKVFAPLSGQYRNKFTAGMGGAIRSEFWACIAPANPDLAVTFAKEDACTDHTDDGVYAEMFLAALESAAFCEDDLEKLVEIGFTYVPENSRLYAVLHDTLEWYREEQDILAVRGKILEKYKTDNWTDVRINLSFILLSLISSEGSFDKAICTAATLGYDADCTAATVGAIFGAMNPDCIDAKWTDPIGNQLVLSYGIINMHEPDDIDEVCDNIISIAQDVCEYYKTPVQICDVPANCKRFAIPQPYMKDYKALYNWELNSNEALLAVNPILVNLVYPQQIAAMVGKKNNYKLKLTNTADTDINGTVTLAVPRGWRLKEEVLTYALKQGETCELTFEIDLPKAKRRFMNNILNINLSVNGLTVNLKAGLPVSKQWKVTKIMAGQQTETFIEKTGNSPDEQVAFIEEPSRYFTVPAGTYSYAANFTSTGNKQVRISCSGTRPFIVFINGAKVFERTDGFYVPTMHRDGTWTIVDVKRGVNTVEIVFDDHEEGEFCFGFGTLYGCATWIDTMEFVEIEQ